jgi:hypothetical protein
MEQNNININNNDCPICMDNICLTTDCCTTECGHRFHSSCLFKNFTNSVGCPLCRKELIEYPDEDEDEDIDDEDEDEYEENSQDEEPSTKKLTIVQIHNAIKKQGYSEKDLISFILADYFEDNVEINESTQDKSSKLLGLLESLCLKEIAVDYRDSRTYASVLLGIVKTEEPGEGPRPIF